ncbi:PEP-CTERM sorting domain-containing protein [Vibrio sp.]|nr:PEP-CTERM sorting domain-containing protein [Vibrio sp.]
MINKLLKPLLLLSACLVSGQTFAAYLNLTEATWGIDVTASGDTSNVTELDGFDYVGYSVVYVEDTDGSGTLNSGDKTTDYGYLQAADSALGVISATYSDWTGVFNGPTSVGGGVSIYTYSFDAGSELTWEQTTATGTETIIEFALTYGLGTVSTLGEDVISNIIEFQFEVTSVLENYFYLWIDGQWVDMYDILNDTGTSYYGLYDSLIYSFTTTTVQDNNLGSTDTALLSSVSGIDEADIISYIDDENSIFDTYSVSYNDGNIDFGVVPEPGMLSLMGLAFLGLAGFQYRRKNKNTDI